MKQSYVQALTVYLIAAVVVGGSVAVSIFTAPSEEEELSFTGKVDGISSYNQPKLDLP